MLKISKSQVRLIEKFCSHTIEPKYQHYDTYRTAQFAKYRQQNSKAYDGCYNSDGATSYGQRHKDIFMKAWVSDTRLKSSNIGVGTNRGSLDQRDDIRQFNGIIDSVLSGVNVVDTCANFRGGRSESVVAAALRYLIQEKKYKREQFLLSSKAGYIRQQLPAEISQQVINQHCVHPLYLEKSLHKSLQKLNVSMLDVFYINNFAQCQLPTLGRAKFEEKLCQIFDFCQKIRKEKKIQHYGLASFQSFRLPPSHPNHLNLANIVKLAQKVGGRNHGLRFLQIPINIQMPEAFAQKNQQSGSLLETAQKLKVNVVSCSPLLSGSLINVPLPSDKLYCRNNGAKHLQLIRSIPSPALICTLVGHKRNRHTKKNLQVLKVPLLTQQQWFSTFVPQQQPAQLNQKEQNQA